ncbi:L,D-transpeptidase [Alicyclobacillus fastidiosus]|uniref:L,D-transpeptidase n=1 Tax=Alicyclobacillus fastidiosus TaxID=392011 RepID=A0ABV5AF43_9BACL|nr:L,D-transpeptidase [Alicyclobacillus fastidiosus]WEH09406.1 L,D-transpeptidase [Alicyclobacillus fastidiosus]
MADYRIIVDLSQRKLHLLNGNTVVKSYPVGIGRILTQTPLGEYTIVNREKDPGGPYGAYWLGLSRPHYGIHGTNNPASVGKRVSHGCIRMYNQDVMDLQSRVTLGTRVTIRQ